MTLRHMARELAARIGRATRNATLAGVATAQRGQSMVEYSIVLALVAVVAMVAIQVLGIGVGQVFTNILAKITGLGR